MPIWLCSMLRSDRGGENPERARIARRTQIELSLLKRWFWPRGPGAGHRSLRSQARQDRLNRRRFGRRRVRWPGYRERARLQPIMDSPSNPLEWPRIGDGKRGRPPEVALLTATWR